MREMGTASTPVTNVEAEMSRPREKPKSGWEVTLKKGSCNVSQPGFLGTIVFRKTSSGVSREIV
jgi:hypothetical protein